MEGLIIKLQLEYSEEDFDDESQVAAYLKSLIENGSAKIIVNAID